MRKTQLNEGLDPRLSSVGDNAWVFLPGVCFLFMCHILYSLGLVGAPRAGQRTHRKAGVRLTTVAQLGQHHLSNLHLQLCFRTEGEVSWWK